MNKLSNAKKIISPFVIKANEAEATLPSDGITSGTTYLYQSNRPTSPSKYQF